MSEHQQDADFEPAGCGGSLVGLGEVVPYGDRHSASSKASAACLARLHRACVLDEWGNPYGRMTDLGGEE